METVKVTYTNPLQVPLTDAEFAAQGTALMDPLIEHISVVCVRVCAWNKRMIKCVMYYACTCMCVGGGWVGKCLRAHVWCVMWV